MNTNTNEVYNFLISLG